MVYPEIEGIILTLVGSPIVLFFMKEVASRLPANYLRLKSRYSSAELIRVIAHTNELKIIDRFLLEEAFRQLFLKPLSINEIGVFLLSDTPSAAFCTYLKYRPALELNENCTKVRFREGKNPTLKQLMVEEKFLGA